MTAVAEPTGTLAAALEHTTRLLKSDPVLASEQASEILKVVPATRGANAARRRRRAAGDPLAALEALQPLVANDPNGQQPLRIGITLGELDRRADALAALRRAVALRPDMPDAWREIGDLLTMQGDSEEPTPRMHATSRHRPRIRGSCRQRSPCAMARLGRRSCNCVSI